MSGRDGGKLLKAGKGTFVPEFENAADQAEGRRDCPQPVLTPFGYHLIRLDERKGDSLSMHHILKFIKQGDSAAMRIGSARRHACEDLAASATDPAKFDSAAKKLGLLVSHRQHRRGSPAMYLGHVVPSASAWAFGGAQGRRVERPVRRRPGVLSRAPRFADGRAACSRSRPSRRRSGSRRAPRRRSTR